MSLGSTVSTQKARPCDNSGTIQLTELEGKLCSLIDDFTQVLKRDGQNVECCIAGGWVRDKLLGLESNDIDIALSSMMGFPFAVKFAEYLDSSGIKVTRVTKVESRAEQSKHLETAKVATLGLDLDFVNLRSEEYAEESRIPTKVEFGTKLEDTLRRDITINALLYNIHTRSVEDHTRKGLDDLHAGIVRTPLPPRQTFLDDPLRVLRCVRFASRFGYDLVPELMEAAKDPEIQTALNAKITRERVGEEVHKMMKGPDPLRAIQLIDTLGLHRSIFAPPASLSPPIPVPDAIHYHTALAAASILHRLLLQSSSKTDPSSSVMDCRLNSGSQGPATSTKCELLAVHPTLLKHALADPSTKRRLYLASALTPFRDFTYLEKKKAKSMVEACIREALKLGIQDHYVDGVPMLFAASNLLSQPRLDKFSDPSQRMALGLVLRDKTMHNTIIGSHWTSSLLFSLVQDLVLLWDLEKDTFEVDKANEIITIYNTFVSKVEELELPLAVDAPSLLNGREITSLLSKKPGPWTGRMLSRVIEWQLEYPQGSKEDCARWLKAEVDAGRIVVESEPPSDGPKAKKAKLSKE